MQRNSSASSDELLWVNVKKPTDIKNAGVMKQIRSHTQREVRRKERISKPKCISTTKRTSKGGNSDSKSLVPSAAAKNIPLVVAKKEAPLVVVKKEEPTEDNGLNIVEQRRSIQQSLQDLAAESFIRISPSLMSAKSPNDPIRLNQKIYRYLRLWQGDRAFQLCGGSIHGKWEVWMPTVLTNNTMMYAQAFCAATHFEFWGGQSTTADTWALKDQAVMQVNKNLGDPDFSQNDSNVAAVLCLAFASHVENSGKDNCIAHLHGLQKIMDMRGGWKRTPANALLSDLLTMADYLSAIIYNSPPVYSTIDDCNSEPQGDDLLNSPLNPTGIFLNQPDQGDLSSEAFHTLSNMQQLTMLFKNFHTNSRLDVFGSTEMENFARILQPPSMPYSYDQSSSSSSSPIESNMVRSFSAAASSPSSQSSSSYCGARNSNNMKDSLDEAVRLSGWIYYRTLVRNIHFDNEANLEDARQLKHHLDATAVTGWTDRPGPLLWVLLIATAALRSQPEGFNVSGHLSTSVLCIGVRNWDPVRRMLDNFMLVERLVEQNAYNAALCESSNGVSPASASVSSTFSRLGRKSSSESDLYDDDHLEGEAIEKFKDMSMPLPPDAFLPGGILLEV